MLAMLAKSDIRELSAALPINAACKKAVEQGVAIDVLSGRRH
jgi:hypothetical protein